MGKVTRASDKPVAVVETEVTFWHKGRAGTYTYETGKNPLTNVPIEKTIFWKDHLYKTSDPKEIEELDAASKRGPHVVQRFDEYQMAKAAEPILATMEAGGKKFTITLDALREEYIKNHPELLEEDKTLKVIRTEPNA